MTFGLTPQGFNRKRLPDIVAEEENGLIAEFGDINTTPQSVFGQFIGVISKTFTDIWEQLEAVYFSSYPNTAEGVSLDYVVALNGITRLSQARTRVIAVCEGLQSTLIPEGSLAQQPLSGEIFFAEADSSITQENAVETKINVDALADQIYACLINTTNYFFSLPIVTFDDVFVGGNQVFLTVNGVQMSAVPFNTNSQTTLDDVRTALLTNPAVATVTRTSPYFVDFDIDFDTGETIVATLNGSPLTGVPFNLDQPTTIQDLADMIATSPLVTSCTVTGARQIFIVGVDPFTFVVNSVVTTGGSPDPVATISQTALHIVPTLGFSVSISAFVTGGASQPVGVTSFDTPASKDQITQYISAVINAGTTPQNAVDNSDNTFTVFADDTEVPFSISLSVNLTIVDLKSPVVFLAQNYGVVPCPIGSLTVILTPVAGWESVTNLKAGVTGRNTETDAQLRLRRQNSIRILGAGTVEAIRSRLLQQVPGVTQALVFENRTMTEEPLEIIFSSDFITGNIITATVNDVPQTPVNFTSNQLTTMNLIKILLESIEGIDLAVVGGTGNRTLTVSMTQGYQVEISFEINGGASQTDYVEDGGRFPKSFEAVVQGGTDSDVAYKIWNTKPAGIQTFGNTSFTIVDSMGNNQVINFSRPQQLYIWITCALTLNPEQTFPTNGVELVRQAFLNYGNSLEIGEDVLFQKVQAQIFNVPGIASGNLQIASTASPTTSPSYGTSSIAVPEARLAVFDLSRIVVTVV